MKCHVKSGSNNVSAKSGPMLDTKDEERDEEGCAGRRRGSSFVKMRLMPTDTLQISNRLEARKKERKKERKKLLDAVL